MGQITERADQAIAAAVERYGQGEEVVWECTLIPAPSGEPVLYLVLSMKGAVLGTHNTASLIVQNLMAFTDAEADRLVHDTLEALRRQRSQQLAETEDQQQGSALVLPR